MTPEQALQILFEAAMTGCPGNSHGTIYRQAHDVLATGNQRLTAHGENELKTDSENPSQEKSK